MRGGILVPHFVANVSVSIVGFGDPRNTSSEISTPVFQPSSMDCIPIESMGLGLVYFYLPLVGFLCFSCR